MGSKEAVEKDGGGGPSADTSIPGV